MIKLFGLKTVFVLLLIGTSIKVPAQDNTGIQTTFQESTDNTTADADPARVENLPVNETRSQTVLSAKNYRIKTKFIEGGVGFMSSILLCLIFGLAIVLERIIYLTLATTNTEKLLRNVEDALDSGGVEAAKELCRNTRGPVASIFYQGLERESQGLEMVEKSIISYGGVQMGLLERGLNWIALFKTLSLMLGFLGTIIGMIITFDNIQIAGDFSPSLLGGGIKTALITTVFGLISVIILQVFYTAIVVKIDSITNKMEDATISFMDILIKHKHISA